MNNILINYSPESGAFINSKQRHTLSLYTFLLLRSRRFLLLLFILPLLLLQRKIIINKMFYMVFCFF